MKRRTFYIALIICVCIGAIAEFGLSALVSKNLINVCTGDECTTTVKEYKKLDDEEASADTSEGGLLGDAALIAPGPDSELISPSSDVVLPAEGESVDEISYLGDEDVSTEDGVKYGHNIFVGGLNVTTNQAGVDGILFAAGNKIRSHGVQDYLFTAGNDISVDSSTNNDVFVAGNLIDFSKNASARDVYGAGNIITVRGEIDGSVNFAGSKIVFDNAKIRQDVNLAVGSIEFKGDSKIYGTLSYNSSAITTNLDQNKIAGIKTYINPTIELADSPAIIVLKALRNLCVSIVSVALLAALLARLLPKRYESLKANKTGIKDFCIGLISIIVAPAIIMFLLFTAYVSSIGMLGLITMILFFIFAVAVAAIRLGKCIESITKADAKNTTIYSTILYGSIAFAVLSIIPFINGIALFLLVLAGFGYMIGETIHVFLPILNAKTTKK